MRRSGTPLNLVGVIILAGGFASACGSSQPGSEAATAQGVAATVDVTVTEGTSMSVAVSPDGQTLAIDLQGSIWTLPASGGAATRITDVFNDARQPVWSPDGGTIAFFSFRDGGYDIWAVEPDGTNQRKLTWGPFDDREPAWSHDGTRLAFASDRGGPLGGDYNVWVLDVRNGDLQQVTTDPSNDFMPSWSPDDTELAFISQRDDPAGGGRRAGPQTVYAARVAGGAERRLTSVTSRSDAPSWGPGGDIVYHAAAPGESRLEVDGKPLTGSENAFPFRVSWASATEFYYTSDGKIRKRSLGTADAETIEFTATVQVTPPSYTKRPRDFDSTAPRKALGIVGPAISPDGTHVAFAALSDIYVMPIGEAPENITNDSAFDTDPAWSPDGSQLAYSSDKGGDQLQIGATGTVWCPMVSRTGLQRLWEMEPEMRTDPRFALYPAWMQRQVSGAGGGGVGRGGQTSDGELPGTLQMLMNIREAGGTVVAGTDSPNAFNLHGELMAYVIAGMTPYQALRAATVVPAEMLGLDAGSIEAGKLADLVIVEGNPLEDIAAAHKVRQVISNGRVYSVDDLLEGTTGRPVPASSNDQ